MALQPSQTKAAVKVNRVSVKASSILAAPRRRCVTEAVASSSIGMSRTSDLEGRMAEAPISRASAVNRTTSGMIVSRRQNVRRRRHKVHAAMGQAGQVAQASSLMKPSAAVGSSLTVRQVVVGQMASNKASARLAAWVSANAAAWMNQEKPISRPSISPISVFSRSRGLTRNRPRSTSTKGRAMLKPPASKVMPTPNPVSNEPGVTFSKHRRLVPQKKTA